MDRPNGSQEVSTQKYEVRFEFGVKVPMRDDMSLSADIYRPEADGEFPVVLERIPYSSVDSPLRREWFEKGKFFAKRGYVYVLQDCRGKNDSEGEFYPLLDDGLDGYDTQEWAGLQPWSNGNVGTIGSSYGAWNQLLAAVHGNAHVKCMVPIALPADPFNYVPWERGVFHLWQAAWVPMIRDRQTHSLAMYDDLNKIFMHLPLVTMDEAFGVKAPFWKDWITHSTYDDYWRRVSYQHLYHQIKVPALHITGWFDECMLGSIMGFIEISKKAESQTARRGQKLIIGPWPHNANKVTRVGDIDFGPNAVINLDNVVLRWFDYWLKGVDTGIMDEPPVSIFVMGKNEWRREREWPLARTRYSNYYFHSNGRANSMHGDGELSTAPPGDEPPDCYIYDPENPFPYICAIQFIKHGTYDPDVIGGGAEDQRPVERRDDVLVFTSKVIEEPMEVTGPVSAVLYAASSAPDTDFFVKWVDVFPNGYAMRLREGLVRARYRESNEHPTLIEPNRIYEYNISIGYVSNLFQHGHRIRVEVASSCFPKHDRNLNTGQRIGYDSQMKIAQQIIYHNREHASHITLPLVTG